MSELYKSFHGKILLFGEYTTITGSKALVIPLKQYYGRLAIPEDSELNESELKASRRNLYAFFDYLSDLQESNNKDPGKESHFSVRDTGSADSVFSNGSRFYSIDLDSMRKELDRGLFFHSSIPQEYGAGSSAALVASIYDAFVPDKINCHSERSEDLLLLRHIFSKMESHFHGTSSGIDPVCSYTGRTIIREDDSILMSTIPDFPEGHNLFIVDSKEKAETAPLVIGFKNRLRNDSVFASIIEKEMTELVNLCIHLLSTGSWSGFTKSLNELSRLQLENFDAMIPDAIRQSWNEGLRKEIFTLKLCGSGGGGFFLGYTDNLEGTARFFAQSGKKISPLDL